MDQPRQPHDCNVQLLKKDDLGSGSYGAVCKAMIGQRLCAAKLLHPIFIQSNDPGFVTTRKRFEQECCFLNDMKHPHIVEYLGTSHDPDTGLLVLLMELMDESLTHFLEQSQQPLAYYIEIDLCHDIAQALAYIHSKEIIHRDLSGNNVLLIAGRAKITDFGMSKLLDANRRMTPLTICPGNSVYMPPEALSEPPVYSKKIDCFSFGVLQIQIMTRQFPDPGPAMQVVEDSRSPTGTTKMPVLDSERRKSHIDLIHPTHTLLPTALGCLSYLEKDRPSAQDLCQQLAAFKEAPCYIEGIQLAQLRVRYGEQAQQIQHLRQQRETLQQELQTKDTQLQTKDQQLQDSQRRTRTLQQELQTKETQLQTKDQQCQTKDQQLQASQRRTRTCTLQQELQTKDTQLQTKDQQLQDSQRHTRTLQQELRTKETQLQTKDQQCQTKDQQLQASQRRTCTLQQKLQTKDQQLQASQRRTRTLQQELQTKDQQLQASQRRTRTLQQELQTKDQQLQASQRRTRTLQLKLQTKDQQLQASQRRTHTLQQKLQTKDQQLQDSQRRTRTLQQELQTKETQLQTKDQQLLDSQRSTHTLQQTKDQQLQDSQRQIQQLTHQVEEKQHTIDDKETLLRELNQSNKQVTAEFLLQHEQGNKQLQDTVGQLRRDLQQALEEKQAGERRLRELNQQLLKMPQVGAQPHETITPPRPELQQPQLKEHATEDEQLQRMKHPGPLPQKTVLQHTTEDEQLQPMKRPGPLPQKTVLQHTTEDEQLQPMKRPGPLAQKTVLQHTTEDEQLQPMKQPGPLPQKTVMQQEAIRDMRWQKVSKAPEIMCRGSAAADSNMAFFNDWGSTTVHSYDSDTREWRWLPDAPHTYFTLVVVHRVLTMVGGLISGGATDSLLSLMGEGRDIKWLPNLPAMPTKRYYTAAVCSSHSLIVAGGYDSRNRLATVEVLDTDTRQWSVRC